MLAKKLERKSWVKLVLAELDGRIEKKQVRFYDSKTGRRQYTGIGRKAKIGRRWMCQFQFRSLS